MTKKVRQRDVTDCGAACIASVTAHYNVYLPVSRIRQYSSTDQKGTTVLGLVDAFEKLGFESKGVRGKMESLSKIPLPAIAHVVYPFSTSHFVVVIAVGRKAIKVMDPADGKFHFYTRTEFETTWTGILVLAVPKENLVVNGPRISIASRFLALLRPHRKVVIQSLVGAMVYTVLGLSVSIYVQKIVDYVLLDGNRGLLNVMSLGMLFLIVVQAIIGFLKNLYGLRTGQLLDSALIVSYYRHLMKLPQRFFDTMRIGEIISRFNDAFKIRAFVNEALNAIIVNLFVVIFSIGLMFSFYWKLAVLVLLFVPFYVLLYLIGQWWNNRYERSLMEKTASLESHLVESLNAIRTIKAFGLEVPSNRKMEHRFFGLLNTTYDSGTFALFSSTVADLVSRILTIVILWSGAGFVLEKQITPGELLSFYALLAYFTGPLTSLIGVNKVIQSAVIAADRLFELMDLELDRQEGTMDLDPGYSAKISFKGIEFRYGATQPVFEDLNLEIEPGQITGIVGESGSGKSTLMVLLQDFYPVQKGHIYIGDYDIRHLSSSSLRRWMSIVPQGIDLFDGNIVENIAVGSSSPDFQKIHRICNDLGIMEFIEKLPQGFFTPLGENGVSLSGGQRQRLAVARALNQDPQLLILDEGTSAMDSGSEQFILDVLESLRAKGKMVIVITHRISTIRNANRIVVLDAGKVVEEGTHAQLLRQCGPYFRMWTKQNPLLAPEWAQPINSVAHSTTNGASNLAD